VPTLIEWDTDIPPLELLLEEVREADRIAAGFALEVVDRAPSEGTPAGLAPAAELAATQQAFCDALFDASHGPAVQSLLKRRSREGGNPSSANDSCPLANLGSRLRGNDGLAIYRGNLAANWEKALSSAYPVIRALVGDEFFGGMSRAYGKRHPSQDADLNRFGEHFAGFVAGFEHAAAFPYLPDMARLEWAVHQAHYAPDAASLDAADFATLTAATLEASRFTLHPACAIVASSWSIATLWLAHQPGGPPFPAAMQAPSCALVCRPGWQAQVHAISPAAQAALATLAQGDIFGAALDAAFGIDDDFDVAGNLRQWVELGVFSGLTVAGK
jgi:hypothetical protein